MKDTAVAQFIPWPESVGDAKFVVAGPCSAESRTQMMETAAGLAAHRLSALRAGVWKPRTRPGSFEGSGSRGLEWLKRAGESIGVPVATEVAHPRHVEQCLRHDIDILWIGARTTGDPFAVQALADALRGVDIPVLIKNPVSPDLGLWIGALERVGRAGVKKLAVIHRGFSTLRSGDYRNSPTWRIPIELRTRRPDVPLLCDPSHICGRRRLLLPVPFAVWRGLAAALSVLPSPPLTRDQLALLAADNVADPQAPGFGDLGLAPAGLRAKLPECLGRG